MTRLALLIDGENVPACYFPDIARHCLLLGNLYDSQVFGDFSEGRHSAWLHVGRKFGVEPVLQLSGGKGKNSTDIAMTIHAMDVLYAGIAEMVCLVSSDRDFVPLARRLRRGGLQVVGIGRQTADTSLAECCDEFFLLPDRDKSEQVPTPAALVTSPPRQTLSSDERAFMMDLMADVCRTAGQSTVLPAAVAAEVRKRKPALAKRLSNGNFLKSLRRSGLVIEHGEGPSKTISAKTTA